MIWPLRLPASHSGPNPSWDTYCDMVAKSCGEKFSYHYFVADGAPHPPPPPPRIPHVFGGVEAFVTPCSMFDHLKLNVPHEATVHDGVTPPTSLSASSAIIARLRDRCVHFISVVFTSRSNFRRSVVLTCSTFQVRSVGCAEATASPAPGSPITWLAKDWGANMIEGLVVRF